MATYNTAFGSLPGYNEQMGTTNTTGGGQQQTYNPQRQQRQQRQQSPRNQPQTSFSSQTFAQMQQQGVARPAPQGMYRQQPYGGGAQRPQMLGQLQQQLGQMQGVAQQPQQRTLQRGAAANDGMQAQSLRQQLEDQRQSQDSALTQFRQNPPSQAQSLALGEGTAPLPSEIGGAGEFANIRMTADGTPIGEEPPMDSQRAGEISARRQQLTGELSGLDAFSYADDLQQDRQYDQGAEQYQQEPLEMYQGLLGQLQQQLGQSFDQPSGFSTEQFQQIRGAQAANLQQEFSEQQRQLNEDLSRRGLSASTIGAAGLARLAGAQSRALSDLDAKLLQQQAEMSQRGRETALSTLAQATGQLGQQALGQQEVGLRSSEIQQRGEQFGLELSERQASRLQQLGISTQELGLKAREIQQSAELEGRRLTMQEAQNQATNEIERSRIVQQGQQFGLQLDETKASRLQQFEISANDLGLRTKALQQEATLQGRQMSINEAQNIATNQLEKERINNQARQFGLRLDEDKAARLQQLGISDRQLDQEATRITNQALQFGRQITETEAQNRAQNNLEQQRINEAIAQRTTGVSESALERSLRTTLQSNEQGFQRGESALERALRTQLLGTQGQQSMAELQANLQFQRERLVIEQAIANAIAQGKLQPQTNIDVTQTSTPQQQQQQTQTPRNTGSPQIDPTQPPIGPGSFIGQQAAYGGSMWTWNGTRWNPGLPIVGPGDPSDPGNTSLF